VASPCGRLSRSRGRGTNGLSPSQKEKARSDLLRALILRTLVRYYGVPKRQTSEVVMVCTSRELCTTRLPGTPPEK